MKRATLTETKNNLSAIIDRVRRGETVLLLDRGRPVARIEPAIAPAAHPDDHLERLERQGVISRASSPPPLDLIRQRPPRARGNTSILQALLDERGNSR
jgi:prevent-host-death family protein